jgi:LuxR family maltose regulon positive regulatory protein
MDTSTNILSARPVIPGQLLYLDRPRIDELIGKALMCPVVLVLGGAGYGKTHAIYSYLQKHNIRTVWLQLTERDNIGGRFWENFTLAISMISEKTAEKLAKQGFPATAQQFEQYLAIPLEDIEPRVKYVFVYDDLHLIHDKTVLDFLEHSISVPFANITSILISRKELSFNLMKLFSKGLLAEINEDDIRFRQDEIEAFFAMQGIHCDEETLASVYADTEGWAFAIHLAGLYLRKAPPGAGYKAQVLHSTIYQLIESEVVADIAPDLRKFLIKLTLIGDPSTELVKVLAKLHVSGSAGGEETERKANELISRIEGIGSFIRFDDYRHAFRLHRLFADYLADLQNELSEQEKTQTYLAAADWCAANKQKIDAIEYYEKAGCYEKLLDQVYGFPMGVPTDTIRLLLKTLRNLPKEVYEKYPVAYVFLTRYLLSAGLLEEARDKLWEIIREREQMEDSPINNRVLFGCYNNLGFISLLLSLKNDDYDFPQYYKKGRYYAEKWGGTVSGSVTCYTVGAYSIFTRSSKPEDMRRYLDAIAESVPDLMVSMNGCSSGYAELTRGEEALFRVSLDEATGNLREAVTKAREKKQYEIEARAWFYLMRIAIYQGDISIMDECVAGRDLLLEVEEFNNRHTFFDIYRGWIYTHFGDGEKISPWLKEEKEEMRLNLLIAGLELLIKAKYCLQNKEYSEMLLVLERAEKANMGLYIFGRLEIKAMKAVCLYQMHKKNRAYEALEEARLIAEPSGYYLPFAELGKHMRALASQAIKEKAPVQADFLEKINNIASAYAKKYYAMAEKYRARTGQKAADGKSLSENEHDILIMLFQGLTQEEIAENASKSINTIKSIIKRVYDKLGAENKADAIRVALSRGILDWDESEPAQPAQPSGPAKPAQPAQSAKLTESSSKTQPKRPALRPLLIKNG